MSIRFRIRLTSAMWVPVLLVNALALALALLLPLLDKSLGNDNLPIPVSAAQSIFGALAAGMITFTGIVFSAVFVAAQIQTSSYSPRVAARLRRDPVVIAGLALPTATATYALFALAAIGRSTDSTGHQLVPTVTVIFGLVMALLTLGAFVALVQRAFENTQIGGILRELMRREQAVMDDVHPRHAAGDPPRIPVDPDAAEVRHSGQPGVIAAVDRDSLLALADQTGGFVEVVPIVGNFVPHGAPVLRVHGGSRPDPKLASRVLIVARQRTVDQDPAFLLRMLVDIAIRGLSPAINDPTTAVQALDRIETTLVELYDRQPGPLGVTDATGATRGFVPSPSWNEYFALGVMEIRHYGQGSIQIARRLHALYARLLSMVGGEAAERVELERRLLDQRLDERFPDRNERRIVARADRMGLGGAP